MKKVILSLIVIILIAAVGGGGWYLWDSLQEEKNRTNELENKIENLVKIKESNTNSEEKSTNEKENKDNTEENKSNSIVKTYKDIKGTYESQKINMNEGTDIEPYYMNYTLVISEEGTFAAYYLSGDTSCHYVGYYTINNNKLTLNSVVFTGNDPSASLSNKVMEFTLNNDGTIEDKENNKFTKKSETPREDTNIAKVIDSYMAGASTSGKDGQGPWFSGLSE